MDECKARRAPGREGHVSKSASRPWVPSRPKRPSPAPPGKPEVRGCSQKGGNQAGRGLSVACTERVDDPAAQPPPRPALPAPPPPPLARECAQCSVGIQRAGPPLFPVGGEGERRGRGMRSVCRARRRTKARRAAPPAGGWEEAAERPRGKSGGLQASAATGPERLPLPLPRPSRSRAGGAAPAAARGTMAVGRLRAPDPPGRWTWRARRRRRRPGPSRPPWRPWSCGCPWRRGCWREGRRGGGGGSRAAIRAGQGKTERSPGRLEGRYAVRPPREAPRSGRRWLGRVPGSAVAASAQLLARASLALSPVRKSGG